MKTLPISPDLSLPLDAVTQKFAFLARTGAGKTYTAMKLCELMLEVGAQVVALDPVGVWWGLRLAANGKDDGYSIPVFGGEHGDIPLEPKAGALVADLIVDRGISAVLDVSMFESKSQHKQFATDFAERLFFRKKSARSAIHLFFEESQEFVPQFKSKGEEKMLGAFERLIKLGRNFGIGASLISQRPQSVNKDVLNQTECLFALQTTGPHERKAITGWIHEKGLDEDIEALLPKLQIGEAHVWSPAWLNISKTIHISKKITYDASATPTFGAKESTPKELSPVDVDQIKSAMNDVVKRAEENDPRVLHKQIHDLRKQLKQAGEVKAPAATIKEVERPVLTDAHLKRLETAVKTIDTFFDKLTDVAMKFVTVSNDIKDGLAKLSTNGHKPPNATRVTREGPIVTRQPVRIDNERESRFPVPARKLIATATYGAIPEGEAKVLAALIQYPNGLERRQLTVIVGYKRSTRDAYIARLVAKGFVQAGGPGVLATNSGREALPDFEPLPVGEDLQDYWLQRLPQGEAAILKVLIQHYPSSVSRDVLTERTGFKRSTRDAYIARLSAKELVGTPAGGFVIATDNLF